MNLKLKKKWKYLSYSESAGGVWIFHSAKSIDLSKYRCCDWLLTDTSELNKSKQYKRVADEWVEV